MFRAVLFFTHNDTSITVRTQRLADLDKTIEIADRLVALKGFTGYHLEQYIAEEIGWAVLEATGAVID